MVHNAEELRRLIQEKERELKENADLALKDTNLLLDLAGDAHE
jgi:hypothetical protein